MVSRSLSAKIVLAFCSVVLLAIIPPSRALSQNVDELSLGNIQAEEGAEDYNLKVVLKSSGAHVAEDEDESYYNRHVKKFEFDSVDTLSYVQVSPRVDFSVSGTTNGFNLIGKFRPETTYKVTLKAGLRTKAGETLKQDATAEVATHAFQPKFSFKSKARYIPEQFEANLPYESVNYDEVELVVRHVYSQNLHHWLTTGEQANSVVSDEVRTTVVKINNKKNERVPGAFSISDLQALGKGVFEVSAYTVVHPKEQTSEEDDSSQPAASLPKRKKSKRFFFGSDSSSPAQNANAAKRGNLLDSMSLVVTNISAVVKSLGAEEMHLWTLSTNDLKPIKGAHVDLISVSNTKLDHCEADSAGECKLKWGKGSKSQPYMALITHGKDSTYVRFSDVALKNERFQAGERPFQLPETPFDAFVYSERDLYRPGETVHLSALVRNPKYEVVSKLPVRWRVTNPRGKIARDVAVQTTELGMASLDLATNGAFETGKYTAELLTGKTVLHAMSFLIEEFVPERIGIVNTPEKEVAAGKGDAKFKLKANYLFGPPVADGAYKVTCSLKPAFNEIPKNADYKTGVYSTEEQKALLLEPAKGSLDKNGQSVASCPIEGRVQPKSPIVYQLNAKAEVNEAGSARVTTKSASMLVASSDSLIGAKYLGSSGKSMKVAVRYFDFKGEPLKKSGSVTLKVFRVRKHWYYSYDYNGNDGYHDNWHVEELISPTGLEKKVNITNGQIETAIDAPENWGEFIVRAVDDKSGLVADNNVGYIGYWWGEGTPARKGPQDPESVKIQVSKNRVKSGEKFKAMVDAPFAGRMLVALEGEKIFETRWIDVQKPGPVDLEFTAPQTLPNFYVTALVLKNPKDSEKRFIPARAWGARSVTVLAEKHQLSIDIVEPDVVPSRREVTIDISNKEKEKADYSVAVVDEGILQMTSFVTPDPINRFFDPRRLDIISHETIGWTFANTGAGQSPGGDRANGQGKATMPVKLVEYWFPHVESDGKGNAKVKFVLPAFQGKVRVMVVGSAKNRMGGASGFTTVRDPLVLLSTLPRFVIQGDQILFPVSVTNASGKDQTVNVSVESSANFQVAQPKQTATLTNNQMKTLVFSGVVKGFTGIANVKVAVSSSDKKQDSLETFTIPIRPSGFEQTIRLTSNANKEISLADLKDMKPDFVRVEAIASNSPFTSSLGHLDALIHYPYGCIEQTTSSTFPLLTVKDLLKWGDSKIKNDADIKDMVEKGIARVLSMQTSSGGFGYWPGADAPHFWGTAYATAMLLEAKKVGYEVPQTSLNQALDYLYSNVRNLNYQSVSNRYSEYQGTPLALYVLAKGGKNVTQELRQAIKVPVSTTMDRWGLEGENRFLFAATAKLIGDQESLRTLTADPRIFSVQLAGARDDYYTYWSPIRSDGLRLSILEDIFPNNPASDVIAQRLAAELSKASVYYSTQEMAWAVNGLGKRLRGINKSARAGLKNITFAVNGQNKPQTMTSDSQPVWYYEGAVPQKMASANGAASGAWLHVKLTGVAKTTPPPSGGITIERRFLNEKGEPTDPTKIPQGEVMNVELTINSRDVLNNIAIVDRLPAGLEIENPRLKRSDKVEWMPEQVWEPEYMDIRDDRIQLFGKTQTSQQKFYYAVRAVTRGSFTSPGLHMEAMYDPTRYFYGNETRIQIVDPKK